MIVSTDDHSPSHDLVEFRVTLVEFREAWGRMEPLVASRLPLVVSGLWILKESASP